MMISQRGCSVGKYESMMIRMNLTIAHKDLGVSTLRFWMILMNRGIFLIQPKPVKNTINLFNVTYWMAMKACEKVTVLPILTDTHSYLREFTMTLE